MPIAHMDRLRQLVAADQGLSFQCRTYLCDDTARPILRGDDIRVRRTLKARVCLRRDGVPVYEQVVDASELDGVVPFLVTGIQTGLL